MHHSHFIIGIIGNWLKFYTQWIAIITCVFGLGLGFSNESRAGAISDAIRQECPEQYQQFEQIVDQYAIRMKANIFDYGCNVVSAYGLFIEYEEDRIVQWEDHPDDFIAVDEVFTIAEAYNLDVEGAPILFDALFSLVYISDDRFIEKLISALSDASRRERARINTEPERILYLGWAISLSNDGDTQHIFRNYRNLMRRIPLKFLPVALILDSQIAISFPMYSETRRLELILGTIDGYSIDFFERVVGSPRALENVVFLLPPQADDIPNIQRLTDIELSRLHQGYVDAMQAIVLQFEQKTSDIGLAMEAGSILAPYILEALSSNASAETIVLYLQAQIQSPVFHSYFDQSRSCNKGEFIQYVAKFFTYLAPQQEKNGKVVAVDYLRNNLARIAGWYSEDGVMRQWIVSSIKYPQEFIRNMAWLPYYYERLNSRGRKAMSMLLQQLSESMNVNASFILVLHINPEYFDWVQSAPDAETRVTASEEVGDRNAPKYLYILTTPYPSQDDPSLFDRYLDNHASPGIELANLQRYSKADLERHEFTAMEKWSTAIDTADTMLNIAFVAAVPLTGGASIGIMAARIAAKQALKKSYKYAMKSGYRYARKTITRNVRRSTSRLAGKEGKKLALRESKELIGVTKKRGRPSLYAKEMDTMRNGISKGLGKVSTINLALALSQFSRQIFCNRYGDSKSLALAGTLCGENLGNLENEDENICQSFSQRTN